jgi:hypothetical protein
MKNSAAYSKPASPVTYLPLRDAAARKTVEQSPIRFPWTDELERRRRAVARWRGNDVGLKETMMRD